MGLMDFLTSAASKYGPGALKFAQGALQQGRAGGRQGFVDRGPSRSPYDRPSEEPEYRPRRRAGLTARDIKGAQKVARVVQTFGYKPKMQRRKKRR